MADFTNFSRRSETTGWRFNALVLLVNDVVVYRAWGGQPRVMEVEISTNPLGPLQDMAVSGVLTYQLKKEQNGTQVEMIYRVSGNASHKLLSLAGIVDKVLGEQLEGFRKTANR